MLITEELLRDGLSEGEQFVLSGPENEFQPKAGQIISIAIHELAPPTPSNMGRSASAAAG
jgi:hypothetical protein